MFGLELLENKKKNMRTICSGPMTTMMSTYVYCVLKVSEIVSTGLLDVIVVHRVHRVKSTVFVAH